MAQLLQSPVNNAIEVRESMNDIPAAAATLSIRDCPACETANRDAPRNRYSWLEWELRECRSCGFVYLENPPTYDGLVEVFGWETNHGERDERMRREYPLSRRISKGWGRIRRTIVRKPDRLASRIRKFVPPGQVVELGCGTADRLAGLPDNYRVCGIEISAALAHEATRNLAGRGGTVLTMPALDGLTQMTDSSVTGILMRSFLEHEANPMPLLAQALRALEPRGAIIVKVPNFASVNRRAMGPRWCGFRFPGHVNYFTPRSLAAMMTRSGFTVVDFGLFSRFPLSDNMWLVARPTAL